MIEGLRSRPALAKRRNRRESLVSIRLYVEGGGDHNKALQTECRRGFSEFIKKAGLEGRMPRVVACGGRRQAYDRFKTALEVAETGNVPLLLVDSEESVTERSPWDQVRLRAGDQWERPPTATDDQIHFMVQTMEAWFHADKDALRKYFGGEFQVAALAQRAEIENIPKASLLSGLRAATQNSQKGEYTKGEHSFRILALIDPMKVRDASPAHAGRFLSTLQGMCRR